jgi:DNA helicase-2/ATP-dependent DNA helicase PcrA
VEPDSIAVLCRVNAALLPVHVALADRRIPLTSVLDTGVLERSVLRAALAWLRIGLDPEHIARADLFEAVGRPSRGLSRLAVDLVGRRRTLSLDETVRLGAGLDDRRGDRWLRFCEDLTEVAAVSHRTTGEILDVVVERVGLERAAAALDAGRTRADRSAQSDDLVALRRTAALHPDAAGFEGWLRAALERPSTPGGVLLTTVHRVKGMEWPEVIVYGADRGLLPHDLASDWEEERRVFHVALTRAAEHVTVLADRARPSPFLAELSGAAPPVTEPARRTAPAAAPPAPADPTLVERLKQWRLDTARARGVPAYVVLHDATIEELARRRPRTEGALATVPGIGPAKLDAYGDDLLELVGGA